MCIIAKLVWLITNSSPHPLALARNPASSLVLLLHHIHPSPMASTQLPPLDLVQAVFIALLVLSILPFVAPSSYIDLRSFLSDHKLALSVSYFALLALLFRLLTRPLPIYLLDFSCYRPEEARRCSLEIAEYFGRLSHKISPSSEAFMRTIYRKSGIGDSTYGPPYIFQEDFDAKMVNAVVEAREGMFGAVDSLLGKTQVEPREIEVVIVGCSVYAPTPSLTSMLVNRYGFSAGVRTFNLSGMGCSAGTTGVDLAARMLRRRRGLALLVVTENTGLNWYTGDNKHMLVTNCIFRVGTAAVLLTSDPYRRVSAKMELVRTLRTHHGANDAAYRSAMQDDDEDGNVGISLTKDLVRVAGAGLRDHIRILAPKVLPVSELLRYCRTAASAITTAWWEGKQVTAAVAPIVPDFTSAFEHICIHTGGKAVIDAVGRLMKLGAEVIEPARMTLHRFGNTSSSLVYYQLAYFEAKGRIKKGDRVWVLAFGTGFKACSVVWKALRGSRAAADNPWNDSIHRYPL